MGDELPDLTAFGASFTEFVERMSAAARGQESPFVRRLREHLGADPKELPSISAAFPTTDHPNLQLALDDVLADADVIGISGLHPGFMMMGMSGLLGGGGEMGAGADIGP